MTRALKAQPVDPLDPLVAQARQNFDRASSSNNDGEQGLIALTRLKRAVAKLKQSGMKIVDNVGFAA